MRWRPPLFRALKNGTMLEVERLITDNPQVLHQYFTEEMEECELQWESQHWYQLQKVTPLYVAAAYAQAEAVCKDRLGPFARLASVTNKAEAQEAASS